MLKVKEIIEGIKKKSFTSDYKATDTEAMGLLLSKFFNYTGTDILEATMYALEDANFHQESAEVGVMLEKLKKE